MEAVLPQFTMVAYAAGFVEVELGELKELYNVSKNTTIVGSSVSQSHETGRSRSEDQGIERAGEQGSR
jgi:hypothetical protein